MATSTRDKKNYIRGDRVGESNNSTSTTSSQRRSSVYDDHEGQWHDKHSVLSENKSFSNSVSLQDPPNGFSRTNSTRVRSSSVERRKFLKEAKNQSRRSVDAKKPASIDDGSKIARSNSRLRSKSTSSADDSKSNVHRQSSASSRFDKEPSMAEKKTDGYKDTKKFDTTSGDLNERSANAKIAAGSLIDSDSIIMDSTECISPNAIFFSRSDFPPDFSKFSPLNSIYSRGKTSSEKSISNTPSTARLLSSSISTATNPSVRLLSSSISTATNPSVKIRSSETGKANSEKVKDPYKKCNTNVWFSCMSVGSCRPSSVAAPFLKKDRPLEIDNLSSKEREIRVSWADKHRPGSLTGFICHKQQAQLLKQLISQGNCPHILFQGPAGSGKKALTMALLRDIYGASSWRVSHELRSFELQGKRHGTVSLPIASSPHHMELNVLRVAENSRYVLMRLIKELARNSEIALLEEHESSFAADYKVMILYEVDRLSKDVQHIIRWMMDRYTDAVKLVLCSDNDSSLVDALKNRCQVIKVDAPLTHEIMEVLLQIAKKERFDLPMSFAAHIASKSKQNLRRAIMSLEACKAYQYPFQEDQPIPMGWEEVVTEIATDILMDPTSKRVFIVRLKLQRLLSDCVNPKLILQSLMEELLKRVPTAVKGELYNCYAYSDKYLSKGNVLIKLEEFVAKVISIYASHLKEHSSTI